MVLEEHLSHNFTMAVSSSLNIMQANINHCSAAQDLLVHAAMEAECSLVSVSEPYAVPANTTNWLSDTDGWAALFCRGPLGFSRVLFSGCGFVAAVWGDVAVCSCYVSPNIGLRHYENLLESLRTEIRGSGVDQWLVFGDFNVWATLWGSRSTNARGRALID